MEQEHEYSVLGGLNRARIGHTIGMIAACVSSAIVTIFLALVDLAKLLGWSVPPVILWPLGAGAVYASLYWIFNRYVWKLPLLTGILRVPNLSGNWHCEGETLKSDKTPAYAWNGEVTIIQSWDRIRVRLKTQQSGSNSVAAALLYDEADGFRLLYNYKNDPNIGEPELISHRGSAEIIFDKNLRSARGEYFNEHGRYTFGIMQLTRKD